MIKKFEVKLDLPVSVNRCYWFSGKRKFLTKEAKDWDKKATWTLSLSKRASHGESISHLFPKGVDIKIKSTFYFADKRRRDASNYLKRLYDVLPKSRIIYDDSQFKHEEIVTIIDSSLDKSYVFLSIEEID